jgi:hypothetical protein
MRLNANSGAVGTLKAVIQHPRSITLLASSSALQARQMHAAANAAAAALTAIKVTLTPALCPTCLNSTSGGVASLPALLLAAAAAAAAAPARSKLHTTTRWSSPPDASTPCAKGQQKQQQQHQQQQ